MSHSEVYKWFELYFPQYAGDKVESWFQNGKNSIRIRQKNHQEFIFTFNNEGNWRFETVESFMNGLKGGKKDWMLLQGQSVNSGASINRLQSLLP